MKDLHPGGVPPSPDRRLLKRGHVHALQIHRVIYLASKRLDSDIGRLFDPIV
jgi:hypothetical protein